MFSEMFNLVVTVIMLLALFHETSGNNYCLECIKCLERPKYENHGYQEDYLRYLLIDHKACPSRRDEEYRLLQQIQYMYKDVHNIKVPCYTKCLRCQITVKKSGCKIEELKKSYLETLFDGIFYSDEDQYLKSISYKKNDTEKYVQSYSKKEVHRNSSRSLSKRQAGTGCITSSSVSAFLDQIVDLGGTTWYPIFFNFTLLNCQFYEDVSCGSPSCALHDTLRSVLVTTMPPWGTVGYSFTLFNQYFLQNVKFHNVYVGGYCEHHS